MSAWRIHACLSAAVLVLAGIVVTPLARVRAAGALTQSEATRPDGVLWRSVVPEPERPHGEVRILRRGTSVVVQTVLVTRLMKRAIGEIAKKEESAWADDSQGHEDAQRYLRALEHARDLLWKRYRNDDQRQDRRQRLMIEVSHDTASGLIVIAEPRTLGKPGFLRVTGSVSIERVPVSLHYAARNMRLIVADSFAISEKNAADLLDRAGPRAGSLPARGNEPARRVMPPERRRRGKPHVSPPPGPPS